VAVRTLCASSLISPITPMSKGMLTSSFGRLRMLDSEEACRGCIPRNPYATYFKSNRPHMPVCDMLEALAACGLGGTPQLRLTLFQIADSLRTNVPGIGAKARSDLARHCSDRTPNVPLDLLCTS
jgi:hypothetical protein